MTKQDFLLKLQDELELETQLTNDTNIIELDEWDSMTAMVLIGFISNEFDVSLTLDDINSLSTVESIILRIGSDKFE